MNDPLCIRFSLFKTNSYNFHKIFDFFIILILMAAWLCLGARAGKDVALPLQNEFLKIFKEKHINIV